MATLLAIVICFPLHGWYIIHSAADMSGKSWFSFLGQSIQYLPLYVFWDSPFPHLTETSNNVNNTPNANRQVSSDTSTANSSRKRSNVSEKGPRVRTVLSEQQLQTLRTVYASNPRPDALLKEHLVELTGLSPRVIRVWFQNKRCKDKKKAIQAEAVARQQQQQQQQQTQGTQQLQQGKVHVHRGAGGGVEDCLLQLGCEVT